MLQVSCPSIFVDEDAIHTHLYKIIVERPQYIIHHPHEICWGIFQTKGHDKTFKKTFF
jgi:hypothetical protein